MLSVREGQDEGDKIGLKSMNIERPIPPGWDWTFTYKKPSWMLPYAFRTNFVVGLLTY